MKRMIFFVAIVLLASLGFWFIMKKNSGVYERNDEKIPSPYQAYQPVTPAYQGTDFSIEAICSTNISLSASPNPVKAYESVNDQIIINCARGDDETSKGDNQYYKIAGNGTITDSLYVKYSGFWTVLIDSFTVATKESEAYFTSWPLNGDTTRKRFRVYNADFSMPGPELEATWEKARRESQYHFVRAYVNNRVFTRALYYCKGGEWNTLWKKTPGYESERDSESAMRYQNDLYRSGDNDPTLQTDVQLEYFHQQDRIKYYHNIGGGAPATEAVGWRGTGFFKTTIDKKPFHFSIPDLVVEKERSDGFKTRLYGAKEPKSSVVLISTKFYHSPSGFALYAPDASKMYRIKPNQ